MSDQDIFGNDANTNTGGDPAPSQTDPFADQLNMIKNENGEPKYADTKTALDALAASQQFIPQLKDENAQLKQQLEQVQEQLNKMGNIDDFVKKLSPQSATPPAPAETPPAPQGISEDKIAELMEQRLNQREQSQRQEQNLANVVSELQKQYGDKAAEVVKQKAQELGSTVQRLQDMARENPSMALTLLGGVKAPSTPTSSPSTTVPPMSQPKDQPLSVETGKGIARGGYTDRQLTDFFKASAERTNKRLGVET